MFLSVGESFGEQSRRSKSQEGSEISSGSSSGFELQWPTSKKPSRKQSIFPFYTDEFSLTNPYPRSPQISHQINPSNYQDLSNLPFENRAESSLNFPFVSAQILAREDDGPFGSGRVGPSPTRLTRIANFLQITLPRLKIFQIKSQNWIL